MGEWSWLQTVSLIVGQRANDEADNGTGRDGCEHRVAIVPVTYPVIAARWIIQAVTVIVIDVDRLAVRAIIVPYGVAWPILAAVVGAIGPAICGIAVGVAGAVIMTAPGVPIGVIIPVATPILALIMLAIVSVTAMIIAAMTYAIIVMTARIVAAILVAASALVCAGHWRDDEPDRGSKCHKTREKFRCRHGVYLRAIMRSLMR